MAAKAAHDAARAKAQKEKKLLAVLMLPLLLAGFYAYHTLAKGHSAPSSAPVADTTTTSGGSTTSTTTTTTATTPAAPSTAPSGATAASSSLASLTLLASKDPFHDGGPHSATSGSATSGSAGSGSTGQTGGGTSSGSSGGTSSGASSSASASGSGASHSAASGSSGSSAAAGSTAGSSNANQSTQSKPASPKKQPVAKPNSAVLSLNDRLTGVALGKPFGRARGIPDRPIFKLLKLTTKTATIAVVGSHPAARYVLTVDKPRLVGDAHGNLYTLMLLPTTTPLPGAPPVTRTATSTATPGG